MLFPMKLENVPFSCKAEEIMKFLKIEGIEDFEVFFCLHSSGPHKGNSNGIVYLLLFDERDVTRLMRLNKKKIKERSIDISRTTLIEMEHVELQPKPSPNLFRQSDADLQAQSLSNQHVNNDMGYDQERYLMQRNAHVDRRDDYPFQSNKNDFKSNFTRNHTVEQEYQASKPPSYAQRSYPAQYSSQDKNTDFHSKPYHRESNVPSRLRGDGGSMVNRVDRFERMNERMRSGPYSRPPNNNNNETRFTDNSRPGEGKYLRNTISDSNFNDNNGYQKFNQTGRYQQSNLQSNKPLDSDRQPPQRDISISTSKIVSDSSFVNGEKFENRNNHFYPEIDNRKRFNNFDESEPGQCDKSTDVNQNELKSSLKNDNNSPINPAYDCFVKLFPISENTKESEIREFFEQRRFQARNIYFSTFDSGPHMGRYRQEVFVEFGRPDEARRVSIMDHPRIGEFEVFIVTPYREEIDTAIWQKNKLMSSRKGQTNSVSCTTGNSNEPTQSTTDHRTPTGSFYNTYSKVDEERNGSNVYQNRNSEYKGANQRPSRSQYSSNKQFDKNSRDFGDPQPPGSFPRRPYNGRNVGSLGSDSTLNPSDKEFSTRNTKIQSQQHLQQQQQQQVESSFRQDNHQQAMTGCKIKLTNLAPTVSNMNILEFFRGLTPIVESLHQLKNPDGSQSRDWLIAFNSHADALRAYHSMNGKMLHQKKVVLYLY